MAKQKTITTAQEIQRRFVVMLVLMALIMGGAVFGTVGYQLVKQTEQSSRQMNRSLNRSFIDDKPDWNYWQKSSPLNTRSTYVRVFKSHKYDPDSTFYSPNTKKFLKTKHYQFPIFSALDYTPGYGITYYRSGHHSGFYSEIWMSLTPIMTVLFSVLVVTVVVALLMIAFGWVYVRRTARKITEPLASLNVAAQEQAQTRTIKAALPVPDRPLEVAQLAKSFNELLSVINQKATQERHFISNAAHELRTPIAAIRGHVQLVERRGEEHPEIIPRSIKFIDEESNRMQKLVNSLLTLSRADRGVLKLAYVDVSPLINETAEEERAVLKQPLTITGDQPAVVNGNAESIQQILAALLDNAGKYSPADQPITLVLAQTETAVEIRIQDLGLGISDEDKSHIFERFYRVDSARTRDIGGTGLGLAIVDQLVKLNDATIHVEDNQPQGSQFVLRFPRVTNESENLSD